MEVRVGSRLTAQTGSLPPTTISTDNLQSINYITYNYNLLNKMQPTLHQQVRKRLSLSSVHVRRPDSDLLAAPDSHALIYEGI